MKLHIISCIFWPVRCHPLVSHILFPLPTGMFDSFTIENIDSSWQQSLSALCTTDIFI